MVIGGMEQLSRCFLGAGLRPAWRERTSQWTEFANRRGGLTGWVPRYGTLCLVLNREENSLQELWERRGLQGSFTAPRDSAPALFKMTRSGERGTTVSVILGRFGRLRRCVCWTARSKAAGRA